MMMEILASVLAAVVSYLLGSVSSAILVSKIYAKDDIRKYGSGNAGMTNILRTYGKGPAACTLLGDFFKGALAVLLSRLIFSLMGVTAFDGGYIGAFCALLGHLFPVYFGFRGGKGVLTSAGAVLVLNPVVLLSLCVLLVPFVFIVKIVSLTSVLAAILFPIFTWAEGLLFRGRVVWQDVIFAVLIGCLVLFMHRENIKRLLNGTEARFGQKK